MKNSINIYDLFGFKILLINEVLEPILTAVQVTKIQKNLEKNQVQNKLLYRKLSYINVLCAYLL